MTTRIAPLPVARSGSVPATVHQIWVGPDAPPPWVRRSWEIWQERTLAEGVDLRIWTNDEVRAHPVLSRTAEVLDGYSPRALSNMLRVQITALYGGMYVDVDCVPLGALSDLFGGDSWIACAPKSRSQRQMENSCFAFAPAHPFLAAALEDGVSAHRRGVTAPYYLGGSRSFRTVWDREHYDRLDVRWDYTTSGDAALRRALWHGPTDDVGDTYGPFPVAHVFRPRIEE